MANRLKVAKVASILELHERGWSQRRIARELGVSRGAVARHLLAASNEAKAPTGSDTSNGAKAPTGSGPQPEDANRATPAKAPTGSRSECEPFREQILEMLDQGLSAQRIFQDLVAEHDFQAKYSSVRRYVARLGDSTPLPFRRMEATRIMKSWTAPARTAPITIHKNPGRKPNCAASTGPSSGPAPAMAAK